MLHARHGAAHTALLTRSIPARTRLSHTHTPRARSVRLRLLPVPSDHAALAATLHAMPTAALPPPRYASLFVAMTAHRAASARHVGTQPHVAWAARRGAARRGARPMMRGVLERARAPSVTTLGNCIGVPDGKMASARARKLRGTREPRRGRPARRRLCCGASSARAARTSRLGRCRWAATRRSCACWPSCAAHGARCRIRSVHASSARVRRRCSSAPHPRSPSVPSSSGPQLVRAAAGAGRISSARRLIRVARREARRRTG